MSVCKEGEDVPSGVVAQTRTAQEKNQEHELSSPPAELGAELPSIARRTHTLVLTGSLDRGSVGQLEAELERLCDEGVSGITLDLRGLTHIEAIGVSVVAFRSGLYERRGYEFVLIRGPRAVQRVFEQAGLGELLPFQDGAEPEPEPAQEQATPRLRRELVEGAVAIPSEQRPAPGRVPAPALTLARLETVAGGELG